MPEPALPALPARAGPLLEIERVDKSFGAVEALRQVSLAVGAGEVVALVGENGAGKSTLIKILAGIFPPDGGEVRVDGSPATFRRPADAMARGIAVVHQDLHLCDNLSIAANLFLGREPVRWPALGWIDRRRMEERARHALERVGLQRDPRDPVAALGPAARQLVEIARALDTEARCVVMDEPTASIDHRDAARLLELVMELRQRGVALLWVSHRLEEVTRLADRAVVLRDGRVAGELGRGEVEAATLVDLMVGAAAAARSRDGSRRAAGPLDRAGASAPPAPVLRVRDLRVTPRSPAISFELAAGEILGLFGLVGAGRTGLLETIFGVRRAASGDIELPACPGVPGRPGRRSRRAGERGVAGTIAASVAMVPEDRKTQGLVAEMTIAENLALADLARRPLFSARSLRDEERRATALCRRYDVRPPAPGVRVDRLSGGNQQKVALAKWLALEPRVLLLDEPTRGVDVGARAAIHRELRELARSGVGILLSSGDTEEVLALADRVLVLHRGAMAGALEGDAVTEESLVRLAAGGAASSPTGPAPRPRSAPASPS